jgi:hypothetical protein
MNTMENNKEKALDDFLGNEEAKDNKNKDIVINEREGLIERIDIEKKFVTKDGRTLLREQY